MIDFNDKFNYYKKHLDKTISKIDSLTSKESLSDVEQIKLSKLIYNSEYFLLICQIYYNIIKKNIK